MEQDQKKAKSIIKMYEYQTTLRSKSDPERFEAMAFAQHRLPADMIQGYSPVKPKKLYSSEGVKAIETFNTGFMGNIMSPNQDWFMARIVSRDPHEVREPDYGADFTEYVKNAMKDEMNNSNFYAEESLATMDCITGGYSCTMFQNNPDKKRVFATTFEPWRCWFDTDAYGNNDQFFYRYDITGRQLIERFRGIPDQIMTLAKRGLDTARFQMLMVIVRRDKLRDYNGNVIPFSRKLGRSMEYAVYHILLQKNVFLQESGYRIFPVAIHVWEKAGDSQYGRGLVMKYLPEFSKLNREFIL